jgi:hypothetical protein
MTMTNGRPDLSSEGTPDIDKRVNVNRNQYPVVRPRWALKPGLTDRLVVGRNVTLTRSASTERPTPRLVEEEASFLKHVHV